MLKPWKTGGWQEPKIVQPHRNDELREYGDISPTMQTTGRNSPQNIFVVRPILTPDRENKRQNGRRMKEDNEPMFTLTGQDIHGVAVRDLTDANSGIIPSQRIIHKMKIRRLTPLECERLQGFPDGWTEGVSETQRYRQVGNAVTVNVIQAIVERML